MDAVSGKWRQLFCHVMFQLPPPALSRDRALHSLTPTSSSTCRQQTASLPVFLPYLRPPPLLCSSEAPTWPKISTLWHHPHPLPTPRSAYRGRVSPWQTQMSCSEMFVGAEEKAPAECAQSRSGDAAIFVLSATGSYPLKLFIILLTTCSHNTEFPSTTH